MGLMMACVNLVGTKTVFPGTSNSRLLLQFMYVVLLWPITLTGMFLIGYKVKWYRRFLIWSKLVSKAEIDRAEDWSDE